MINSIRFHLFLLVILGMTNVFPENEGTIHYPRVCDFAESSSIPGSNGNKTAPLWGGTNGEKSLQKMHFTLLISPPRIYFTDPPISPFTTESPFFTIQGFFQHLSPEDDLQLVVNGKGHPFDQLDWQEETFIATILLRPGTNIIRVSGRNAEGSEDAEALIIYKEPIILPEVQILVPADQHFYTQFPYIDIKARITNAAPADVQVRVNGTPYPFFFIDPSSSMLIINNLLLNQGDNYLTIEAYNEFGSDLASVQIVLLSDNPLPRITIQTISPPEPLAGQCQTTITAEILHINREEQIEFKVNGQYWDDISYNNFTNTFSSTFDLIRGTNKLEIIAYNEQGSDQQTGSIECQIDPYLSPPKIILIDPEVQDIETDQSFIDIEARILGVQSTEQLEIKVNNNPLDQFYWTDGRKLTFTAALTEGNNSILIAAFNDAGTERAHLQVIYKPKPLPEISFIQPGQGEQFNYNSIEIRAKVTDIRDARSLTLLVNEINLANFRYQKIPKLFSCNVFLREGANQLVLNASNAEGITSDTLILYYKTPTPPGITIFNPVDGITTSSSPLLLESTLSNITRKDQILLMVNDSMITDFGFSAPDLEARLGLKPGVNNIEIKIQNSDGIAEKELTITYSPFIPLPKIELMKPEGFFLNTSLDSIIIEASFEHVDTPSDVSLMVNNGDYPLKKEYFPNLVFSIVPLKKGRNVILLQATNEAGNTQQKIVVMKGEK